VLHMPSITIVTPHYAEAVIFGRHDFLCTPNRHGVTPFVYLKSLHSLEWGNLCERLGVSTEAEAWTADVDACGTAVSGEMELRLWASHRGQTLARTTHGMMQAARAVRLLASLQLELEYAALEEAKPEGQRRLAPEEIEEQAARAAVWFATERFSYVIAAQRYSDHGDDDVRRRSDIDFLMMLHPLLSVASFEASVSPFSGKRRLMTVCRNGRGVRYRLPSPGNPIMDGIGEGKPENQNNAAPFVPGRIMQAVDMNQDGFLEEWLKLPNALSAMDGVRAPPLSGQPAAPAKFFGPVSRGPPAYGSGRPLVILGLREHIFTSDLSAPALFMGQQEYLFGTMMQRIMAEPLHTRYHYGHPDLLDKVFIGTRGGSAKAAAGINVSEDIYAGYNAVLRGGRSGHCEYLQVGKGRDVGLIQIEIFESKISGGTAISVTSRDTFRVADFSDFAKLLSFWHTGPGFYVSNVLIVLSLLVTSYYMTALALVGADKAIIASNYVYIVGDLSAIQWVMQLGLLSIIPLLSLYTLEAGILTAVARTLRMFGLLGFLFFMFEIQSKAYFWDNALAFGRQGYAGERCSPCFSHTPHSSDPLHPLQLRGVTL